MAAQNPQAQLETQAVQISESARQVAELALSGDSYTYWAKIFKFKSLVVSVDVQHLFQFIRKLTSGVYLWGIVPDRPVYVQLENNAVKVYADDDRLVEIGEFSVRRGCYEKPEISVKLEPSYKYFFVVKRDRDHGDETDNYYIRVVGGDAEGEIRLVPVLAYMDRLLVCP